MNTALIVDKAKTSSFYRWLLNQGLNRMIPFNKPHGFKILDIQDEKITTLLPYKRRNFNHIKGLHACALATLSEFTTGFLLVSRLNPEKYRIILKTLEMDYHYQGKSAAYGTFELRNNRLEEEVLRPLETSDAIVLLCEIKIHDEDNNHLSTGKVYWQVKPWDKVKTKVK